MSSYTQRVEALENDEHKKKLLFGTIIVVLVVLFIGGMIIGARNILDTEGTQDPNAPTVTQPDKLDIDSAGFISTFAAHVDEATDPSRTRISIYTDVEIDDSSITVASGNDYLLTELKHVKQGILDSVKKYYEIYEGKFGEDFNSRIRPVDFNQSDILSASCERGKLNDKGELESYDTLFYRAELNTQALNASPDAIAHVCTGSAGAQDIKARFLHDIEDVADDAVLELVCKDFAVTFEENEKTKHINNIWYIRGYTATLTLTFKGDLEALGTQTVSFDFYAKESRWYTWAGLRLSDDLICLEKRQTQAIEAIRTADEEVTVSWVSSDPELVSVDEKGYIKGKAVSDKPVTITAEFKYLQNTYTDTCIVYVVKHVSQINVSPQQLNLQPGQTQQLSTEVSPAKATLKDVLWFTQDKSIAVVDAQGVVTAVGEGTVKVYAISVDGNYRSSCTVTVTP